MAIGRGLRPQAAGRRRRAGGRWRRLAGLAAPALLLAVAWPGPRPAAAQDLSRQRADAQRQQTALQERIGRLTRDIESQEESRKDAAAALKASETAISDIGRRLAALARDTKTAREALARLEREQARENDSLAKRRAELGAQLRAQYEAGLSPWMALLSGDDPHIIGRDLAYLGYVSQAQAEAVRAVRRSLDRLKALEQEQRQQQQALAELVEETETQQQALQAQHKERQRVLARIETQIKSQRGEASRLARDEQRLGAVVAGLEQALAEQAAAEARRRAEAEAEAGRRKAEAAQRAREEQQARAERQRAEAERAAGEKAARERAAQEAAARERAAREGAAPPAPPEIAAPMPSVGGRPAIRVREIRPDGTEREIALVPSGPRRPADTPAPRIRESAPPAPEPAETVPLEPPARAAPAAPPEAPRAAPPAAAPSAPAPTAGLRKGLPWPVRGEVQGRFGAERPEGGLWRGIVVRSPEGTPVRAASAGRVVFASWLAGFGNLMIIDHGQQYLTVYAYNQQLLRQVGDAVQAGDTVASVGATGGQVESGLYFEIRHKGAPVNPLLWLAR